MKANSKNKKKSNSSWVYLVAPISVIVGGLIILLMQTIEIDNIKEKENPEANRWRISYWKTPIPFQGKPAETIHPLAKDLHAKSCSQCHPDQNRDWSASLHSKAMGPGIMGQYHVFSASEKAECDVCHAPMSEQAEDIKISGDWTQNSRRSPELQLEGVTCAACHLRKHQRNAPPLRPGREEISEALHGKPLRSSNFEKSEFCRGCHQHETNTLKIAGKTIENTYIEWLNSPAYKEGKSCQSCHMPDRNHLWKGIHDKKMTASGITTEHRISSDSPKVGESFKATLMLKNTGTGHYFPTYTTPAVYLKAAFLNKKGQVISEEFFEEHIIQRRLNMSTSPWTEYFDTRLAPEESAELVFEKIVPPEATIFKLWVWVKPDEFYEGFYRNMIRNNPKQAGLDKINDALKETQNREYALFSKEIKIYGK